MIFSEFTDQLENLSIESKPHWGIMTPQHMVEHLTQAVELSNGKFLITDCMNPPEKLPTLKRILMSSRPLPKGFVNTVIGAELKPLSKKNLDSAKKELFIQLINFIEYFTKNPEAKPSNPTFGPLSKEEWIVFHKKHFTHHLTQFGLIGEKQNESK